MSDEYSMSIVSRLIAYAFLMIAVPPLPVRHRRRPIGEDPENNLRERLRIDRSFVRFEWIADAVPMSTEAI